MHRVAQESRQEGRILALSFGGDRYFAAKFRARLRVRFPRIYAQLDWMVPKIRARGLLRFVTPRFRKRRQSGIIAFRSEDELGRWLEKMNRDNIGKSIALSGAGEKLKRYLDSLDISMRTTHFARDLLGEAGKSPDFENVAQTGGQRLGHFSNVPVEDAVRKVTETACAGERRRYSGFEACGLYGGVATGLIRGCFLNCIFCWSEIGPVDESNYLFYSPDEVLARLSNVAERYGTAKVRLSGGEPTIGREHLLRLLGLMEKSRFKVFILETNGVLFGLDSDYVKQVSKFKKMHVRLSLKAGTAEGFTSKTGMEPKAFSLPFTAIENLIRYRCRFNVSAMTDPRVMSSLELKSLLSRLNSINPKLIEDLEEESIEPYANSLLRLGRCYPLKWPFPISATIDLPIRC